jgi:hypothetical protein
MIYKLLSGILAVGLLVVGVLFAKERYDAQNLSRQLNNEIAKLQQNVKETETAYSSKALELENLKVENSELSKKLKDRGEEVAALGEVVLTWKNKYFKIKNATESHQDSSGNPVELPEACDVPEDVRTKVEFESTDDYLRVFGYTLTNPAYAEVSVEWVRGLKLTFLLAKDKDDTFRLYLDSRSRDIIPAELSLKIDPSVFRKSWYEKLAIGGSLNVGEGLATSVNFNYELFEDLVVGPQFLLMYDGSQTRKMYGANVLWYPFR